MDTARTLLSAMIRRIRRGGDTPLQFGIDSAALVRASVEETGERVPAAKLDAAASAVLEAPWAGRAESVEAWIERFYAAARAVDPQAIEIVGLRLEGWDDREISDKLGLGPRLVRRIVGDITCSSR